MENIKPFGLDPVYDVSYIIANHKISVILDVGANIGQSAYKFTIFFPLAKIHCIEPNRETFEKLASNAEPYKNVKCYNVALGHRNSVIKVGNQSDPLRFSLNKTRKDSNKHGATVKIQRLTDFCLSTKIKHINYLKIDTEGYDLNVLKGGREMLEKKMIDLIEVEVGMNPTNKYHVNFFKVSRYLEDKEFYLFGLYEQVQEWIRNKPILRRCNALYISKRLASRTNNNNDNYYFD